MSDLIFYVYEHWRPDKGECFYVGKGYARRANVMYGRNRHHLNIQAKLARLGMCVEVRMVAEALSEEDAFELEIERIAFWIADGAELTNLTAGGEGLANPPEETRALMRAAKLGGKLTEEHKAKIGKASREALADPAVRAKLSCAVRESHARPEVKEKLSKFQRERPRSKEQYEKTSAALTGRKLSPEHIAKMRVANTGRKQSASEIANRRAANTGKKRSPEFCARMKAAWTPERRAAQAKLTADKSAAMNARIDRARPVSAETSAKLRAAWTPERREAVARRRNKDNTIDMFITEVFDKDIK